MSFARGARKERRAFLQSAGLSASPVDIEANAGCIRILPNGRLVAFVLKESGKRWRFRTIRVGP